MSNIVVDKEVVYHFLFDFLLENSFFLFISIGYTHLFLVDLGLLTQW